MDIVFAFNKIKSKYSKFEKLKVLVNKLNEKKGVSVVEQKHLKNLKQELMEMIYYYTE